MVTGTQVYQADEFAPFLPVWEMSKSSPPPPSEAPVAVGFAGLGVG